MMIVCDDARTAVAYFNLIKREVKDKLTLHVLRNPCDRAGPSGVIEHAICKIDHLKASASHDNDDNEAVWALIDLEQDQGRRTQAESAKEDGERRGICVALSDPCFEVWTLLHLVDTGESFSGCQAVLRRVEQAWQKEFEQPFGKKAQANYAKIVPNRGIAATRARRNYEAKDRSWTEVYKIIEKIAQFLQASPNG